MRRIGAVLLASLLFMLVAIGAPSAMGAEGAKSGVARLFYDKNDCGGPMILDATSRGWFWAERKGNALTAHVRLVAFPGTYRATLMVRNRDGSCTPANPSVDWRLNVDASGNGQASWEADLRRISTDKSLFVVLVGETTLGPLRVESTILDFAQRLAPPPAVMLGVGGEWVVPGCPGGTDWAGSEATGLECFRDDLEWLTYPGAAHVDGIRIYGSYSFDGEPLQLLATLPATAKSYSVYTVPARGSGYFWIAAFNEYGESGLVRFGNG